MNQQITLHFLTAFGNLIVSELHLMYGVVEFSSKQVAKIMVPAWLTAPPIGLTDAERRVLEAFFVTEEVKPTATLLSLSPKTVQNELLLARQTMNESKSWAASIRYVFYTKRHGHPFSETALVPKIDRQVRRLIDDYLEVEEIGQSESNSSNKYIEQNLDPESDPLYSDIGKSETSDAKHDKLPARRDFTMLPVVADVPDEHFETQLAKLTQVALVSFACRSRARKRPRLIAFAAAIMLVGAAWGFVAMNSRPMNLLEIDRALTKSSATIKAEGATEMNMEDSAHLVDLLCEEYWKEMWGPNEDQVVAKMKSHQAEIERVINWSMEKNKVLALKLFGNGHRGFKKLTLFKGKWLSMLQASVDANRSDTSIHMARALCGVVYGWAIATEVPMKSSLDYATSKLPQIVDQSKFPHDYANSLRHLALTQNNGNPPLRVQNCKRAMEIYENLGDETAKRGKGQCLLSLAESGEPPMPERIGFAVQAYDYVRQFHNYSVTLECTNEMSTYCYGLVTSSELIDSGTAKILLRARDSLEQDADERGANEEFTLQFDRLLKCLIIDSRLARWRVGQDFEELVSCKEADKKHTGTTRVLAGYAYYEMIRRGQGMRPNLKLSHKRNGTYAQFDQGKKLSMAEAVEMAKNWRAREPIP